MNFTSLAKLSLSVCAFSLVAGAVHATITVAEKQIFPVAFTEKEYTSTFGAPTPRYFKSASVEFDEKFVPWPKNLRMISRIILRVNEQEYEVPSKCFQNQQWPVRGVSFGAAKNYFNVTYKWESPKNSDSEKHSTIIEIHNFDPNKKMPVTCTDF